MAGINKSEIVEFFLVEADEHIQSINDGLLTLESNHEDSGVVDEIFRSAHTIKGSAAMLGFGVISKLAHKMEDLLGRIRSQEVKPTEPVINLLLHSIDMLAGQVESVSKGEEEDQSLIPMFEDQYREFLEGSSEEISKPAQKSEKLTLPSKTPVTVEEPPSPVTTLSSSGSSENQTTPSNIPQKVNKSEIVEFFLVEAGEHIQSLSDGLLALESNHEDMSVVDEIFRSAHTIKGSAAMLGFGVISKLAHKMEDLLGKIRSHEIKPTELVINLLLHSVDRLTGQVESVSKGEEEDQSLIPMFEDQYREFLGSSSGEVGPRPVSAEGAQPPLPVPRSLVSAGEKQVVRVNINDLNKLMNLIGTLVINRNRLDQQISYLNKVAAELNFSKGKLLKVIRDFKDKYEFSSFKETNEGEGVRNFKDAEMWGREWGRRDNAEYEDAGIGGNGDQVLSSILPRSRVPASPFSFPRPGSTLAGFSDLEFDKYDDFNILARSLIEIGSDISEIVNQLNDFFEAFDVESSQVHRTTDQLQEAITDIRMVPVGNLFNRFHRPVRDVSKEEGKEVSLVIAGEETRLDKTVIEEIADPLMHLIRNAVSHGIESPEVRESAGKPRIGMISLNAYQEGNYIIIEIQDDGAGIDPQRMRDTAVKKGVKSRSEVDTLSDAEAIQLMFLPGFSTKEKVTSVSGRGVGMDVVKTNISKLNGTVDIKTELGKGTLFLIKLPLTLIIYQALLVRVTHQEFAIPLSSVEETLRVKPDQIYVVAGEEVIRVRDQVFTLVRLNKLLRIPETDDNTKEPLSIKKYVPVVVIGSAEKKIAMKVDELAGREVIVIKSLGDYLKKVRMFSGATISGEGKIRLILDISYIMETVVGQTVGSGRWTMDNGQGAEQDELLSTTHRSLPVDLDAQAPEILVADDSISIRKVVSHFLTNAGYHVEVANDGLEAWDKLNSSRRFDLLITDLEMPKMHGYELITQARNAGRTSGSPLEGLPIIVLTSRSGEKHYQKAVELGANDYLIKPFDEKKLLESIGKFFQPVRATH